ncbi:PIR protein CIR protein [Plasmodium vinckei vinckei]|uniref:PIR protein CIR protein n=1 Tax=Plasmodium vinckei vinckei TaxID=54757 RepID=A0A449BS14_PLAVN|nr:PIR protein CIR protein [Plasmodium vinckei vinckei]VEV56202.1 PIR protein CIR protein [Plasmodium vinckei vinckei]
MMPIYSLKTKSHYNGSQTNGDSYFNDENVDTTKIKKDPVIKGYCRDGGCKTNEDYINALIAYIIMKFKDTIRINSRYNDYDEYLLMWISDKLFKMYHESQGTNKKIGFVYSITLNQAYEDYLDKHKQRLNYWVLLNMQQGLKEANLKYMSEFYKLLNIICKIITDYNSRTRNKKITKYSTDCRRQYRTLYNNIPKCKSYFDLLNKLKGIYDDFSSDIKKNDLKTNLKKLTLENGTEMNAVKGFKRYNFSDSKCKTPKKKRTSSKPSKPNSGPASTIKIQRGSPGSQGVSNATGNQLSNQENTSKGPDNGSIGGSDGNQVSQEGSEGSKSGQDAKDSEPGGSGSEKTDTDNDPSNKGGPQGDQGDSVDGPGSGQGDKGGQVGGSNSDQVNQGGLGSSGDGSGSDPVEKGSQSMSGDPVDTGQSFFRITLKGIDKLNTGIKFFEKHKKKIVEAKETINNLYNTSMSNIKIAYDNSMKILNSIIDNISNQPEKVNMPSTLDGNKLGSGGTGGGPPTPNGSSPSQKDSPQTPSGTSPTTLPLPDPKEQTSPLQSPQDSSGKQNYDQNDQGGSQKIVTNPVVKSENPGTETKGNGITKIGDIYVLKEYKQIGISIIVLLIPITLTILHKYLSSGWRKELKKKTNMKKVINSIGEKKQIQIIIKSSNQKKNTKKSINSVYGEKSPSLNIYKIMQADPVPFINLFFLLIFFVYKRKRDFIEL